MLPQNIFVTLNQIMLCSVAVLKRAALQLRCCKHQRYYQPRLNEDRMLDLHKLL